MAIRILFADDHLLVRQTLKHFMVEAGEKCPVHVDEAASLEEILRYAGTSPTPAAVIVDLSMPGMKGVHSVATVREAFPQSPVVVLSGYADRGTILGSFEAGAAGFIPKTTSRDEFLSALRTVLRGERYVPPAIVDQPSNGQAKGGESLNPELSERERTILTLLADGKKNKEIAGHFALEEVTIKLALSRLYKKLGASNRAAAVSLAIQSGLV